MNVHRHESSVEATQNSSPFPRPVRPMEEAETLTATEQKQQSRYEQAEVERIIAQASALQEVHHRTLSQEQIESIAEEVGIRPEFVRLAMAHGQQNILGKQTAAHEKAKTASNARLAAIIGAYSVISTVAYSMTLVVPMVFIIPAFIAVVLGVMSGGRRRGAVSGASLAAAIIVGMFLYIGTSSHAPPGMTDADMKIFATMMVSGALLGAAGAEGQRVIRRRSVTQRSRKIVRPA